MEPMRLGIASADAMKERCMMRDNALLKLGNGGAECFAELRIDFFK